MTDRPFPPSPRRLALARRSGLTAASPMISGGFACAAAAIVIGAAAKLVATLEGAIAAACAGHATLGPDRLPHAVLALAAPVIAAAALAATLGHLAQTRAPWLPRRRIDGAPAVDRGPAERARSAAFELACATTIGAVAFGWLWFSAPRLGTLVELAAADMLAAGGALLASLLAALAIAWLALAVLDALARHLALARALAMTGAEKREDDRLGAADPRWRTLNRARARHDAISDAVAGAAVLVLGDDLAVAIRWDAIHHPVPSVAASGRAARATQLLGLARRYRIAVHRDPALATSLSDHDGPVPERAWGRLATLIAAVRRDVRGRSPSRSGERWPL